MTRKANPNLEDLDEAEFAIQQRELLNKAREFLIDHDADEELVEAINQAIDDNDHWIVPDHESYIGTALTSTTKKPQ